MTAENDEEYNSYATTPEISEVEEPFNTSDPLVKEARQICCRISICRN